MIFGEFLVHCKGMWQREQPKSVKYTSAFWYGWVLVMWPSQTFRSHPCSLLSSLDIVLLIYYQEASIRWKCLLPLSWNRNFRNRVERRTLPKIFRSREGSPTWWDTVLTMISLLWNMSILLMSGVSHNPLQSSLLRTSLKGLLCSLITSSGETKRICIKVYEHLETSPSLQLWIHRVFPQAFSDQHFFSFSRGHIQSHWLFFPLVPVQAGSFLGECTSSVFSKCV